MKKPELRKNTGDPRKDFGELSYAITMNKHHLANHTDWEEMLALDTVINNATCNLYSLLCNSFEPTFDSEILKKEINKHVNLIFQISDEIAKRHKNDKKMDD